MVVGLIQSLLGRRDELIYSTLSNQKENFGDIIADFVSNLASGCNLQNREFAGSKRLCLPFYKIMDCLQFYLQKLAQNNNWSCVARRG